jgi:hypothetical protein
MIYRAEKERQECTSLFMKDYDFMIRNHRFEETAAQLRVLFEAKIAEIDQDTAERLVQIETRAAACGATALMGELLVNLSTRSETLRSALAVRINPMTS